MNIIKRQVAVIPTPCGTGVCATVRKIHAMPCLHDTPAIHQEHGLKTSEINKKTTRPQIKKDI